MTEHTDQPLSLFSRRMEHSRVLCYFTTRDDSALVRSAHLTKVPDFSLRWDLKNFSRATWVCDSMEATHTLLNLATLATHTGTSGHHAWHCKRMRGSRVLLLNYVEASTVITFQALFSEVVGGSDQITFLPLEELGHAVGDKDRIIAGSYDQVSDTLTLVRGDSARLVVPMSIFPPSPTATPDASQLRILDSGTAIGLGDYEAPVDVVLWECDPEFRRRMKERSIRQETGLGAAIRRLRLMRGKKRSDFPGVASKTIARIERNEVSDPHEETLRIIADTLGVSVGELPSY